MHPILSHYPPRHAAAVASPVGYYDGVMGDDFAEPMCDTFVRKAPDGVISHVILTRLPSGASIARLPDDKVDIAFENLPPGWKRLQSKLERLGFVEIVEAKLLGIVSVDWEPPKNP